MSYKNWRKYTIEEATETIMDYRGKTPKKVNAGIPLITAKVIKDGRVNLPEEFIPEEEYERWMVRGFPEYGDVLLTTEAPLGEVAQIMTHERVALAQRVITLRGRKGIIDDTFLKYYLQSPAGQNALKSRETGTTVTGIKQSELRKVEIFAPEYSAQVEIGAILKSLDDKIEINIQMNRTLEEIAQTIFREWFVNNNKEYPSGTINDVCSNIRDTYNPQKSTSEIPYIGLEHMPRKEITLSNWGISREIESQKSKFQKMDILFGKLRPYFHKVVIAPLDGICSTDILVLRPKIQDYRFFSLMHLSSESCIQYANSNSDGTRMPRVNWSSLSQYSIQIPSNESLLRFNELVSPMILKCIDNTNENLNLKSIRDTLLPKLMSGKLSLS